MSLMMSLQQLFSTAFLPEGVLQTRPARFLKLFICARVSRGFKEMGMVHGYEPNSQTTVVIQFLFLVVSLPSRWTVSPRIHLCLVVRRAVLLLRLWWLLPAANPGQRCLWLPLGARHQASSLAARRWLQRRRGPVFSSSLVVRGERTVCRASWMMGRSTVEDVGVLWRMPLEGFPVENEVTSPLNHRTLDAFQHFSISPLFGTQLNY